ncbi:hypothetical protein [Dyella sp.]|uniref:hypothetical protein n=1 Tax=Dyella sp. TaxID=1869338 RepID=UPI002ED1366D
MTTVPCVRVMSCGHDVEVRFDGPDLHDHSPALATAGRLLAEQEIWRRRIEQYAVDTSLPPKNEAWLEDGDLFWGHSIQIGGNLDTGLDSADIPG